MSKVGIFTLELDTEKHPILIKERELTSSVEYVKCPIDAKIFLDEIFNLSNLAEEHLCMIAMTSKCKPLGACIISNGSNTQALCSTSSIYIRALLLGATGIIIAHNHVSGDSSPSRDDMACLQKIQQAGKIMDVSLKDFIIVGDGVYYSAGESGDLED